MAVILVGFMGSGKTTIGRKLAAELHLPFVDLDEYIAAESRQTIPEIFKQSGEDNFRQLEHHALLKLYRENIVLSTGGGIVERDNNMKVLKQNKVNIWLDTDIEVLYQRIKDDMLRPNANNRPFSAIKDLYYKRSSRYNEIAFINVNTSYSVNDCVNYIISRLTAEEQ